MICMTIFFFFLFRCCSLHIHLYFRPHIYIGVRLLKYSWQWSFCAFCYGCCYCSCVRCRWCCFCYCCCFCCVFFFATQLLIDKILYEIQNRTNKKAYRNQSFRKRHEKKTQIKINGFQHLLTACIRSMMPQRDCVIVRLLAILCFRYYWISRSFCHYNFWNCVIHVGGTKLLFLVFFRLKTKSNNNNNHTENAYDINIIIAWSN